MVYIGNWVLNSTREFGDRITEYDDAESALLSHCGDAGMDALAAATPFGGFKPSQAFQDGGIHEAIADYEDAVFFDILAQELARRDMEEAGLAADDVTELNRRCDEYMDEFEANGVTNITLEKP
jgi:hypothetical protein